MGNIADRPYTLQADLMNHTAITSSLASIASQMSSVNQPSLLAPTCKLPTSVSPTSQFCPRSINRSFPLAAAGKATSSQIPFVLNEANSLLHGNQAQPLLLDVFGTALWAMDYTLHCATIGLSRVHMQQGTGFPYSSWQPITTSNMNMSTSVAYYGNIAAAAVLDNITKESPKVVELDLGDLGTDGLVSGYAIFVGDDGKPLRRLAFLDLHAYNVTTVISTSPPYVRMPNPIPRPVRNYTFTLPPSLNIADGTNVGVQRLLANGSDAQGGVTWDGWSYDYELDQGRPVKVGLGSGESVVVTGGGVDIGLQDSSAVVLVFP